MKHAALLLAFGTLLSAETFPVIHRNTLWRDGRGTVEITDEGISYKPDGAKPGRQWKWTGIRHFERVSPSEFVLVTYEDQRRFLGRDKEYRFVITGGGLSDALFRMISDHLDRPVTDRVPPDGIAARYSIPVKHEHRFGGCEGRLEFTADEIYYVADHGADSRAWRMDRDVAAVWSDDPYRLQVRAYDNGRREFSRTATYKFELKERLDPDFYRQLKLRLYNLEKDDQVVREPLRDPINRRDAQDAGAAQRTAETLAAHERE